MKSSYKNNHYVPIWYQKRFIPKEQPNNELYYLDLNPPFAYDSKGKVHYFNSTKKLGFKFCFTKENLYKTTFNNQNSTFIEQNFFGSIDNNGRRAIDYISNFSHQKIDNNALNNLLLYMSSQKLRTPKGLLWISNQLTQGNINKTLMTMIELRKLFCAIWVESIWQIADASKSETKFILSDHPITIYNRRLGPSSKSCRGSNDPDIRLNGSHTIFPLSLEKILILTNLTWIRNPYKSAIEMRPNPTMFRNALFNYMDIQIRRYLNEQEVREINFIIKKRAYRYIAAAKKEWLYPEKYVSKSNWNTYGNGYLFMPDPRNLNFSGEIIIGYKDGTSTIIDPYGRHPIDPEFNKETKEKSEFNSLHRFKGEFANIFGPYRRGQSFEMGKLSPLKDSVKMHKYHLSLFKKSQKNY